MEKEQIQAGDHSPRSELSLTTGLCNNPGDPPHLSASSGTPASLPTPRKKKKERNLSYYCLQLSLLPSSFLRLGFSDTPSWGALQGTISPRCHPLLSRAAPDFALEQTLPVHQQLSLLVTPKQGRYHQSST